MRCKNYLHLIEENSYRRSDLQWFLTEAKSEKRKELLVSLSQVLCAYKTGKLIDVSFMTEVHHEINVNNITHKL